MQSLTFPADQSVKNLFGDEPVLESNGPIALIVHQLDRPSRNVSTISSHLAEKHSQNKTPISFNSQAMSATTTVSESISRDSVRGKGRRALSIR